MLYLSYVGVLHFGFIDGIYLHYGGQDLENLNRIKFRSFSYFFFFFQLFVSIILFVISFLLLSGYRLVIILFVIFNLIPINFTTYFQFISQITFRFKEYSKRLYLVSVLNLISVLIIYLFNLTNYLFIISFFTITNYFLFILYIHTYKSFIFGTRQKLGHYLNEIFQLFKFGLPLMLSNLLSTLLITIDKVFVELYFDISVFSTYSFAFSILALINIVINSISTVLYPLFKKIDKIALPKSYSSMNFILNLIVFWGLLIYFPVYVLLPIYLPGYVASLPIMRIALAGLVFTSTIFALTHNFFKVYNKNKEFLSFGIVSIVILMVIILISYNFSPLIENIAYSTLFGLGVWYFIINQFLKKNYNITFYKNLFYSFIFIILFLFLTSLENIILGGFIYFILILFFTVSKYKKIKSIIKLIKY